MKYLLLNPGFYFFIFILFVFYFWKSWSKRKRTVVSFCIVILFYLTTTPFLLNFIASKWEHQYAPLTIQNLDGSEKDVVILILGSGHNYDSRLSPSEKLGSSAKARILEALKIKNRLKFASFVTSGSSASNRTPAAEELKNALIELGVAENEIEMQTKPHNTKTEAEEFKRNFGNLNKTLILVTSAAHMPRALLHFNNVGINNIIPAPCEYMYYKDNTYSLISFLPSFAIWKKIERLNKELIGYYFQW